MDERRLPPSTYAIESLYRGERGALERAVALTVVRAIPLGVGMRLAGVRDELPKKALVVSGILSLAMLGYVAARGGRD